MWDEKYISLGHQFLISALGIYIPKCAVYLEIVVSYSYRLLISSLIAYNKKWKIECVSYRTHYHWERFIMKKI